MNIVKTQKFLSGDKGIPFWGRGQVSYNTFITNIQENCIQNLKSLKDRNFNKIKI